MPLCKIEWVARVFFWASSDKADQSSTEDLSRFPAEDSYTIINVLHPTLLLHEPQHSHSLSLNLCVHMTCLRPFLVCGFGGPLALESAGTLPLVFWGTAEQAAGLGPLRSPLGFAAGGAELESVLTGFMLLPFLSSPEPADIDASFRFLAAVLSASIVALFFAAAEGPMASRQTDDCAGPSPTSCCLATASVEGAAVRDLPTFSVPSVGA